MNLAEQWFDAWNRHDLEAILSHYEENIEFSSPFIVKLLDNPSGTIYGKAALRDYFSKGLVAYPDLHFEPIQVLSGVNSLVLYYRSVNNLLAAEYMETSDRGLVCKVSAHYSQESDKIIRNS
ncbi:nuclear transport factor 2 family protein [Oscillatoria sp. FACHB-1406]|uniref:nuclear transport factor 2 family protein n=1 Tax=Oscillatoria sp. FACHB-1406 TaxID=2692846 RepID=UPI00168957D5|nr:nuclear transport factor 2 family protein [Oscillatoria sp. FACHB-1406]MBD2580668.1 nuclear transport factor 2 family protein [Oscillatoria sp. FACHB-1406]